MMRRSLGLGLTLVALTLLPTAGMAGWDRGSDTTGWDFSGWDTKAGLPRIESAPAATTNPAPLAQPTTPQRPAKMTVEETAAGVTVIRGPSSLPLAQSPGLRAPSRVLQPKNRH